MANLLDDTLAHDPLDDALLQQQKEKLAAKALILCGCMAMFALLAMVVTIAVSRETLLFYTGASSVLGASVMSFRLFTYYNLFQQNSQRRYNWEQLFMHKYKLWQALAICLGMTFVPLCCFIWKIIA